MIDDIRSIYCLLKGLKGQTTSDLRMAVCGESAPKKKIPSLSTKKRFVVVDEKSIEEAKKVIVPKSTQMSASWATNVFTHWMEEHNELADNKYPEDI